MRQPSVLALAASVLIACSSDLSTNDAGVYEGTTPGDPNVRVGAFSVRVPGDSADNTSVLGKVYDGPTPQALIWETSSELGGCKLLTPRVPLCSASCGGSAACVENDTCQDYPVAKSVGVVTVTGIRIDSGGSEFSMSPIANNYQPPAVISLRSNAVREGDTIRFSAAGGAYPPFRLEAKGVASLSLSNTSIPVAENQAVSLTWPAALASTGSRIKVSLDISHHGGTKGKIECDAPDTGALEIPARMVTELLTLGVAGFPTIIVTRQTTGSATIVPGRVDLIIASEVERAVSIAGLESCTGDAECTPPKKCQADLTCK